MAGALLVFDTVALPVPLPGGGAVAPTVQTYALAAKATAGSAFGLTTAPATGGALDTEVIETEDFSVLGVTWDAASAGADEVVVEARVREAEGWSDWTTLPVNDAGPDDGTEEAQVSAGTVGTEPLVADDADAAQFRVRSVGAEVPTGLSATVIDPGTSASDEVGVSNEPLTGADADLLRPAVVTRAQWGANESLRRCAPGYSSTLKAAVIHHTAGTNSYTEAEAPGIVRGIYAYHTTSLKWCDVGYNFLVDKFGTVYEGRYGGMERPVRGAHSGGFNDMTVGVAALGNYETASAPAVMVDAIGSLVGWRLAAYGVDVADSARLTSAGGGTSRYAKGTSVTLPAVFGHRDVGSTACPGRNLYAQLATVRSTGSPFGGYLKERNRLVAVEADGTTGSEWVVYGTEDGRQHLVDSATNGRSEPVSNAEWSRGWDHVVTVEADGTDGDELMVYSSVSGRQAVLDLTGTGVRTLSTADWSTGWGLVFAVEADGTPGSEVVVYNTGSGRQTVLDLSEGATRTLSKAAWSAGWTAGIGLEADGTPGSEIVVYNGLTGRQTLLDMQGGGVRTLSKVWWSAGWSTLTTVESEGTPGSEVIVYNSTTGRQTLLDGRDGRFFTIGGASWSPGWDTVVEAEIDRTIRSEVLVYNSDSGRVVYLDLLVDGRTQTLATP